MVWSGRHGEEAQGQEVISYCMSRVKCNDTAIELTLRRALWAAGFRYRKHYRRAPGTPDIAFLGLRIAVICDSSFWHGRDLEKRKPRLKVNSEYWVSKIERNMARDRRINAELIAMGWKVLRFWDVEILQATNGCVAAARAAVEARRRESEW
jgi:DNA mismatch endonuclease, patch repair protein